MGTREKAPDRTTSATRAPALRSAVTNGTRVFLTRGGELSVVGRRWKDLYLAIVVDRGGVGQLSEGQRQLARRIATLAVEAEIMEAERAEGKDLDLDAYVTLTNALGRALGRLGLGRVPKDVTPDLATYLASKAGEAAE